MTTRAVGAHVNINRLQSETLSFGKVAARALLNCVLPLFFETTSHAPHGWRSLLLRFFCGRNGTRRAYRNVGVQLGTG